jgi:23S rRNA (uracil1939-C5)-methyltransferase
MFEFAPQKLVYGGDALGHYQGRTVLVPRALPGERLEVERVRTTKGVVHAQTLGILSAAPERVEPPCPYFGRCGGCHYQHLRPERQGPAKREILVETLRRIGRISWDAEIPLHSAGAWNYRNQAQLKVARQANGEVSLGFFEAESHRLVPIDECLIISPRLNAVLGELRRASWSELAAFSEIELLADDRDEEVRMTLRGSFDSMRAFEAEGLSRLAEKCLALLPGVTSVGIERGREFLVFGKPALSYAVGDFSYQVSHGSFFQACRFLLPELVAAVASGAESAPEDRDTLALDLFAGVGLLTLPLARRFGQVIAVESNLRAAADLAANVEAHAFPNVRAVPQAAFDFLRRFAQTGADLAVIDPPRAGVGFPTLELLAGLLPRRIHYLSCHPPTLARDLACLLERGYQLDSLELFDLFPQTFHIESLARLSLLG